MALHSYRYSDWDGTQEIAEFTADEVLENMADDLLRGGDPEKALRDLLRRGFRLPDGRRFQGVQRLLREMERYRQEAFSRYDPNGLVEAVRQQLDEIVGTERGEIQRRSGAERDFPGPSTDNEGTDPRAESNANEDAEGEASGAQRRSSPADGSGKDPGRTGGSSSSAGPSEPSSAPSPPEFQEMLEKMLDRKSSYLDQLPDDNAGRIQSLRNYDFLSSEAREAFEKLVGGMQRELMEQYFQGLKQGIGNITPDQMDGIRQMVRDLNEMLEASQRGDRGAFDRFMEQYGNFFPDGINNLDELLEHMQRQMSAMESLLQNMDPEQRAQLEAMMDELLRDDRLRLDLARLGANLSAMGFTPRAMDFPFGGEEAPGFGQALDMMRRLQAMEGLENAMRGGDPMGALSDAGAQQPADLFGPGLGQQIETVKDMAESLLEAGYLQRDGQKLKLTARAVRKLGDASLREIFSKLKEDRAGGHATPRKGLGGDLTQESRPFQFGDQFLVDIKTTVMNAVYREGPGTPVSLAAQDFDVFETERSVQHATVLALDMSHSMYMSGLFLEAKKTALALDSLIRAQFPRDALYLIGFANVACELKPEQLPGLIENDYVHGTNYQMALGLARRLLARHRGGNRQILFVTDGEPTACTLPNGHIYFDWPPTSMILDSALMEAARCAKDGITINTFVLDPDPRLIAFADEMTAINRGRMFLAGPYHLQEQVVLDYLQGRSVRHLH
jgi:uncharacterized protein with von Willebrand factor type A (vWA) domain